jgi:hypothetical protein
VRAASSPPLAFPIPPPIFVCMYIRICMSVCLCVCASSPPWAFPIPPPYILRMYIPVCVCVYSVCFGGGGG